MVASRDYESETWSTENQPNSFTCCPPLQLNPTKRSRRFESSKLKIPSDFCHKFQPTKFFLLQYNFSRCSSRVKTYGFLLVLSQHPQNLKVFFNSKNLAEARPPTCCQKLPRRKTLPETNSSWAPENKKRAF